MPSLERAELNELVGNQQLVQALWNAVNTSSGSLVNVPPLVKRLLVTDAWKEREVQQLGEIVRFDSFAAFIQTPPLRGCGWPLEKVEALIKDDAETLRLWRQAVVPEHGEYGRGRPKPQSQSIDGDIITIKPERGTSRAYTLDRLSRERPDLYAEVVAKNLSANKAAIKAGWRDNPNDGLIKLRRAWKHASSDERKLFLAEISNE